MAHVHGATTAAAATGAAVMADMGKMGESVGHAAMKATAVGVGVAAGTTGAFKRLVAHPLVLFGLGFAVGFYAYKYRKEILSSAHNAE
ncbi:hypothetical protein [Methylomonas rivi]|uniref:DUF883 domain-containing protein n=1 Tax=Methylomonas rivi TaxID=2952226 RepID=A0ABT1U972_9GAMM|nr:hypothetical protein [Methylomonas sp. WSC-6]MCQ8130053.1 hypothetical protein [Methylomonas sp. WSC-6]